MSQSQAARLRPTHSADLERTDLLFAVLLHVIILVIVAAVMFWQQQHKTEPLKRIEVMMISAKQLSQLQHHAQRKTAPAKKKHIKPKKIKKPKHKPVAKPKPVKQKARPTPKKPKKVKPLKKPAPKPQAVVKKQDNFDPFAPIASTSDRKAAHNKASTSRPELANLVGKQLSSSEKERYIALMQAAVQQHWKLPVSSADFANPLVEMRLMRNGEVESVRILESSGNAAIDASLIRAIKAAAPFTLPRQQFEFFHVNRLRFHPTK